MSKVLNEFMGEQKTLGVVSTSYWGVPIRVRGVRGEPLKDLAHLRLKESSIIRKPGQMIEQETSGKQNERGKSTREMRFSR